MIPVVSSDSGSRFRGKLPAPGWVFVCVLLGLPNGCAILGINDEFTVGGTVYADGAPAADFFVYVIGSKDGYSAPVGSQYTGADGRYDIAIEKSDDCVVTGVWASTPDGHLYAEGGGGYLHSLDHPYACETMLDVDFHFERLR